MGEGQPPHRHPNRRFAATLARLVAGERRQAMLRLAIAAIRCCLQLYETVSAYQESRRAGAGLPRAAFNAQEKISPYFEAEGSSASLRKGYIHSRTCMP